MINREPLIVFTSRRHLSNLVNDIWDVQYFVTRMMYGKIMPLPSTIVQTTTDCQCVLEEEVIRER